MTIAAFATMEISNHTEQFIVEALGDAGALTVSLVVELDGQLDGRLVGHIASSPVTLSDGTEGWYGLGPISVHPDVQSRGIGRDLIEEGLRRLLALDARGCCLVGHPRYYRRFGFVNPGTLGHEGVPEEFFSVLPLSGDVP